MNIANIDYPSFNGIDSLQQSNGNNNSHINSHINSGINSYNNSHYTRDNRGDNRRDIQHEDELDSRINAESKTKERVDSTTVYTTDAKNRTKYLLPALIFVYCCLFLLLLAVGDRTIGEWDVEYFKRLEVFIISWCALSICGKVNHYN
jgi:hypothetical protein